MPPSIARAAFLPILLASCVASEGEELDVTCDGKCDGIGNLKSLIRDAKELDLGDLVAVGSKFAADGLNDALEVSDFASLRLDEPRFFALPSVSEPDLTLDNIDTLVSGLAARYGERELSTEVNAIRRGHLMSSGDRVFVESAFRLAGNVDWGHNVGGFGNGDARIGFGAGAALEARVISAHKSELAGLRSAPLRALGDLRGFVFPRSFDDVRTMKPGESFALRGAGHLGANLGVGVPILVANPGAITYNLVLSAGLRARIAGELDVQLVRLDGDEVVVDVGMEKVREWNARLALEDSWGVQGLLETRFTLAGIDVDLGKLVDRALQKQLDAKLRLFKAEVSQGTTASRVSISRIRFSLDGGDQTLIAPALAQALRGDVRLAQALSNRGEPGVVAEFDLLRSGSSTTSYAGIDLLGMSFFSRTIASEGQVIIQTPGGARTLMFDSLRKSSGSFFSEHGYTRVGLSGLSFDPDNAGEARGEANLFIQLQEADEFMERDKMLDHVDALILALAGPPALRAVEGPGNDLERFVEQACPNSGAFDPCRVSVLSNPTVVSLRQSGVNAALGAAGQLNSSQRAVLQKLAELRMTAQATYEPKAQLVGPDTTFTIDFQIDDAGLNHIMLERDPTGFSAALKAYAGAVGVSRIRTSQQLTGDRQKIERDLDAKIRELTDKYTAARDAYRRLFGIEKAVIAKLGQVGPRLLEIRVPVDGSNRPVYEEAAAGSLAEARSRTVIALFDDVAKKASGFSRHVEQVTGYALLALLDPTRNHLRVSATMDLSDGLSQDFEHYRAAGYASFDVIGKGDKVAPIDGGQFSIDALLAGN